MKKNGTFRYCFFCFLSFFSAVGVRFHLKCSARALFVSVRICCCRYLVDDLSLWVTFFFTSQSVSRLLFQVAHKHSLSLAMYTPTQSVWMVGSICRTLFRCQRMKENSKLDESRERVRRSQRITAVDKKTTIKLAKTQTRANKTKWAGKSVSFAEWYCWCVFLVELTHLVTNDGNWISNYALEHSHQIVWIACSTHTVRVWKKIQLFSKLNMKWKADVSREIESVCNYGYSEVNSFSLTHSHKLAVFSLFVLTMYDSVSNWNCNWNWSHQQKICLIKHSLASLFACLFFGSHSQFATQFRIVLEALAFTFLFRRLEVVTSSREKTNCTLDAVFLFYYCDYFRGTLFGMLLSGNLQWLHFSNYSFSPKCFVFFSLRFNVEPYGVTDTTNQ